MVDQMIHHGFDVCGGNAVPRRPLFREIWEASAVSAHIVSNLFDCSFYAPDGLSEPPGVLGGPSIDVCAQPRELEKRLPS